MVPTNLSCQSKLRQEDLMLHTKHSMEVEKRMGVEFILSYFLILLVLKPVTYLHERQVAWQVKYASGKVLGIVRSMPPLNFSFRS